MLANNVETRALVPSRRAFIKAAPAAAALAATGATVALPAMAGVNGTRSQNAPASGDHHSAVQP